MRKTRRAILVSIIGLSLLGLAITAGARAPRLIGITPAAGSNHIPPFTPIRMTFSVPIVPDSAANRVHIEPVRNGSFAWEGNTLVFTPSQPWPSGATITVRVSAGIRSRQSLSFPLLTGQAWTFTTSQTLLAYLWPAAEEADLYALDPLTGDIQRFTTSQNILDYSISKDGLWFFYSVQLAGNDTAIWRLQRRFQRSEATPSTETLPTPETILECPQAACRFPKPSPDGNWLVYERTPTDEQGQPGRTSVWLLSLADQFNQPVRHGDQTTQNASWSSVGWLAFYEIEAQRFTVQEPSGKEIGFLPIRTDDEGSWAPGGVTFAAGELGLEKTGSSGTFSSSRLLVFDLTKLDSSGKAGAADLTKAINVEDVSPVFSPDGTWIAFARRYLDTDRWTPGLQLWLVRSDGSEAHPLTQAGDYNHHNFAWSPDGKQLAFMRFNQTVLTDPAELWLIDADGSHPIELVKGGYAPQWIP